MDGQTLPSGLAGDDVAAPRCAGFLDKVSWDAIAGWAWYPERPEGRVSLDILANDEPVATVTADAFRQDLLDMGKGDGRYGFSFILPQGLFDGAAVKVAVRDRRTGIDLVRSPSLLENLNLSKFGETQFEPIAAHLKSRRDGGTEAFESQALFLLGQLDLVMRERAARQADLTRWSNLLTENGATTVASLIDLAVFRYGGAPIHVPAAAAPEVSVIIPVHNQFWYTHQCLRSIIEHPPEVPFEVIIADDASTDETLLAPLLLAGVRLIRQPRNAGFVAAANAGAAAAAGRFLLLLNNDTQVLPGWLDHLRATFDCDPRIAIAGAKLLFPGGALQECGGIVWRLGDAENYGRDADPNRPEFCYMRDADYVSGAALMIRREVWQELGGFHPTYAPGYYEDTDLCFAARAAGYRVVVQPHARIIHHEGISAGTSVEGAGMKRHQRTNMLHFARRWRGALAALPVKGSVTAAAQAERLAVKRALFIDDSVPTPDQDAGSNALLQHMLSLIRLGYQAHFVPADNMANIPPYTEALERMGIRCHYRPFQVSVEEVLRAQPCFDVIYAHRVANTHYLALARQIHAEAKLIYNVADLHHLRLEREAALRADPRLGRLAAARRAQEWLAVAAADHTIVHSTAEHELVSRACPDADVRVIPWVIAPSAAPPPFVARKHLAFIGSTHDPNIDAAEWLVRAIMPLVWSSLPELELHLIGSHVQSPVIRALEQPRLRLIGLVADLPTRLAAYRLTVAPLRFGAGLKGKVLESFAAGVPCVMTPCAAEGAGLPPPLNGLVGETEAALAQLIIDCHRDKALNRRLGEAGLAYVAQQFAAPRIDSLFREFL
jgi:GT2 family glycosyltransferase/glycosyltransferase involved in cell wall biosynthesis